MEYEFELVPDFWVMRRMPTVTPKVIAYKVERFTKTDNSYCKVKVDYDNGDSFTLDGRVNVNDISKKWTVCAFCATSGANRRLRLK